MGVFPPKQGIRKFSWREMSQRSFFPSMHGCRHSVSGDRRAMLSLKAAFSIPLDYVRNSQNYVKLYKFFGDRWIVILS